MFSGLRLRCANPAACISFTNVPMCPTICTVHVLKAQKIAQHEQPTGACLWQQQQHTKQHTISDFVAYLDTRELIHSTFIPPVCKALALVHEQERRERVALPILNGAVIVSNKLQHFRHESKKLWSSSSVQEPDRIIYGAVGNELDRIPYYPTSLHPSCKLDHRVLCMLRSLSVRIHHYGVINSATISSHAC